MTVVMHGPPGTGRHTTSAYLKRTAYARRGLLHVTGDTVTVYGLLKTLDSLVPVRGATPKHFRPVDGIPWEIHAIEDEDAYAEALKGFITNDVSSTVDI